MMAKAEKAWHERHHHRIYVSCRRTDRYQRVHVGPSIAQGLVCADIELVAGYELDWRRQCEEQEVLPFGYAQGRPKVKEIEAKHQHHGGYAQREGEREKPKLPPPLPLPRGLLRIDGLGLDDGISRVDDGRLERGQRDGIWIISDGHLLGGEVDRCGMHSIHVHQGRLYRICAACA